MVKTVWIIAYFLTLNRLHAVKITTKEVLSINGGIGMKCWSSEPNITAVIKANNIKVITAHQPIIKLAPEFRYW